MHGPCSHTQAPAPHLDLALSVTHHVPLSVVACCYTPQDKPWKLGGKQVGEVARFETLSFVKVFQAVSGWVCCYDLASGGDVIQDVCSWRSRLEERERSLRWLNMRQHSLCPGRVCAKPCKSNQTTRPPLCRCYTPLQTTHCRSTPAP